MPDTELKPGVQARITVRNRLQFVPLLAGFVRQAALAAGLPEADAGGMELAAEEACVNVVRHAFDNDPAASFDLSIESRHGEFVVAIEDRGVPYDWRKIESGEKHGLGALLMKALTDEMRFINLGRGGKRLELVRKLPHPAVFADASPRTPPPPAPQTEGVSLSLRLMRPDEGPALARCFYHSYGYSYTDYVYHPEKIRELMEKGLQTSIVAATPEGEIIGHVAMLKDRPDSRVAETGQAIVLPQCRGKSIFEDLKRLCVERARQTGLYGLYSESVTVHPYTQKANHSLGASETGFLLAYGPQRLSFKKIDEKLDQRQTTVLFYLKINEEPQRTVHLPARHEAVILKIYEKARLRRSAAPVPTAPPALPCHARLDMKIVRDFGFAILGVAAYGEDLVGVVRTALGELRVSGVECIYLDLPLGDPAAAAFCGEIERLGFFFAGVIPELFSGDVLRLQYLNNVKVFPEKVVVYSDFGKELFRYVLDAKEKS